MTANSGLPCPDDGALWPLIIGAALEERAGIHVNECRRCRERVAVLRSTCATVRAARQTDPAVTSQPGADGTAPVLDDLTVATEVPRRIGRYQIVRRLAVGGQSTVYLARHPTLNCEVVIKHAHQPVVAEQDSQDRLLREGRILAAIEHRHLARVLDLGIDDDRVFLILEYVRGRNLADLLQTTRLSAEQARDLLIALADAVDTVHRAGVLHLDLKPENVLVTAEGEVKLIDFGLAHLTGIDRQASGHAGPAEVAGTPGFLPPERLQIPIVECTARSDVYGLGAILHFVLCGQPPGDPPMTVGTSGALGTTRRRWSLKNARLERRLWQACRRAIAFDPQQRPESVREFSAMLTGPVSQRRTVLQLAAIVLIVAAGVGFWSVFSAVTTAAAPVGTSDAAPVRLRLGIDATAVVDVETSTDVRTPPPTERTRLCCRITTSDPAATVLYLLEPTGRLLKLGPLHHDPRVETALCFPRSGSFLTSLAPGDPIVLIAATGSRESAHFAANGGLRLSDRWLLDGLQQPHVWTTDSPEGRAVAGTSCARLVPASQAEFPIPRPLRDWLERHSREFAIIAIPARTPVGQ